MRHLALLGCVFAVGAFASLANAQVSYNTILDLNDSVTGVRGTDTTNSGNVLITGSQIIGGAPQTLLWQGNLYTGVGTSYNIMPLEAGTVTSSNFYGPDTPAFNSRIPSGQIRAVGTYQLNNSGSTQGFLYQGVLASGTYAVTNLDVPVAGVVNTIPHSTAGDIVVGNYDLGTPNSGNAFIYSISTGTYQTMSLGQGASLYGVWQTGANTYAIVGGARNPNSVDHASEGFLANYNSLTGEVSDEMYYSYTGVIGTYNHFDGITPVDGGYYLIGTVTGTTGEDVPIGSAAAFVAVDSGTYASTAAWTIVDYPGSSITTGNTIYQNVGMGIYQTGTTSGQQSYTAVIPEPTAGGLITVSALLLGGTFVLIRRKPLQEKQAA